tara:strand:+ start:2303 stop:3538 length:1236 start_codon:yes stop_codon:yes gene_type:complete
MINIALTDPQKRFLQSQAVYPAICGGLGSGKTRAGTMRLIMKMIQDPNIDGAYYMPTFDLLRLRALEGFKEDLEMLKIPFKTNESKMTIDLKGYGNIILRSYDRPERIVAYETAHAIVDEIDTLKKDKASLVWRKISERNRQRTHTPNTIGAVTTPDQGIKGFVYDRWVRNTTEMHELIKAPTWSNPYLPDGYIEQIRSNYDPIIASLYIDGEFVNLTERLVYHFFSRIEHHTDRIIEPNDIIHIGQDFNVGGCCSVCFVVDGNNATAIDEFTSEDTQDLCTKILSRYKGHKVIVYPDASGGSKSTNATRTDIDIIKSNRITVIVDAANPAVRDRINAKNLLLSKNTLLVNTNKCPNYTDALETQGYDKKGNPEKYDTHPAVDDWNDAGGYFIHKRFPIMRPSAAPRIRMM